MSVLLDKDFLKELDNYKHKEVYARITALTFNEQPLETIEGKVTGGSVNLDGASAVRRTCSLSLIAKDVNINDFYWGLNVKFKLEIGLRNFINLKYPDIIWFPQGVFIITAFNTNLTPNGYTISLNGKDKMCLLNGDIGGSLPASVDFGVKEYHDLINNITTYTKIPIKTIIREMIHSYAQEQYSNIIINDLDEMGLELLEYRGDTPLYLIYDTVSGQFINIIFDGDALYNLADGSGDIKLKEIPDEKFNKRIDALLPEGEQSMALKILDGNKICTVSKVEFGQTAGYRITDLVYAGDLISNIGESITSILDKIVQMLGGFEYFYDLEGRFVFQKKKTYLSTSFSPIITTDNDTYVENAVYTDSNTYYFNGNNLVKSFANTPALNNIKNDYSIWGVRKGVSGAEIPIHYRYAIHKKPVYYKNFNGDIFTDDIYDWREIIYQMALDYFKHNQEDNFYITLINNNREHYPTGITGYEAFYTDVQGFWRELYDISPVPKYSKFSYVVNSEQTFKANLGNKDIKLFIKDNYEKIDLNGINNSNKNNIIVLGRYVANSPLELQDLFDTIPVIYSFNDNETQDKYFITGKNNSYQAITNGIKDRIDKREIYVKDGEKYQPLLDYFVAHLDNYKDHYANFEFYILTESDNYIDIENSNMTTNLRTLYCDQNYTNFNKYYTKSKLKIDGTPEIDSNTKTKHYFNYYYQTHEYFPTEEKNKFWNVQVRENPDSLNYWLDFLDTSTEEDFDKSELDAYAISAIGNRPKVVNDKQVKSIYYRDVPHLIFSTMEQFEYSVFKEKSGYVWAFLPDDPYLNYFTISAQGKSAKDTLDELLYNHSYCTESINISTIPIYYLEPNTRISVQDENSKINGEYIISKITLPLTYNGTMSIQATKAPQRLY